jgi:hypothetical protein
MQQRYRVTNEDNKIYFNQFLLVNLNCLGPVARWSLGTPSPWESKERRAGFSVITRTVVWADKSAFLQGWVP